jgi:hypothetical protein
MWRKIAGVRVTDCWLYNCLAPKVRREVYKWALAEREAHGPWPPTVTPQTLEKQARLELARILAFEFDRFVRVSDRSWKYWREVFLPPWSVIEEIIGRE